MAGPVCAPDRTRAWDSARLAKPKRYGAFCEKYTAAALANDRKQRCGWSPVFSALLLAGQAGHVHGGIAQRYERLALTWHGYRREKF
jgi:hypothetical protein